MIRYYKLMEAGNKTTGKLLYLITEQNQHIKHGVRMSAFTVVLNSLTPDVMLSFVLLLC